MSPRHDVAFRTQCGLTVMQPLPGDPPNPPEWTLENVQAVETRAMVAYRTLELIDSRFASPCTALVPWQLEVVPLKNFMGSSGDPVGGETSCYEGKLFIGNSPPDVGRLAHELGHAIQACDSNHDGYIDGIDFHHGWEPIYSALRNAGLQE